MESYIIILIMKHEQHIPAQDRVTELFGYVEDFVAAVAGAVQLRRNSNHTPKAPDFIEIQDGAIRATLDS